MQLYEDFNRVKNEENIGLLNILNSQTQLYNQIFKTPSEIKYLSINELGKISFDEETFNKALSSISTQNQLKEQNPPSPSTGTTDEKDNTSIRESLKILNDLNITLPRFLSKYLESNDRSGIFYSILNTEISSRFKAQNIHIIGMYKDPKTKKWIAVDSSGTKRDISQLKGENLNNEENLIDVKLEESDINAIEKSILITLNKRNVLEEIKESIEDINDIGVPYNLELQLGKMLKESIIQKCRYKLNENKMIVGGGTKQFYVLFEMSLLQDKENTEEIEDNELEIDEEFSIEGESENTDISDEEVNIPSNFSIVDENKLVEIAKSVRKSLITVLENKLKKPLEFKLTKTVNKNSISNKENTNNSTKVEIGVIVSEGDDSYIDASKTDDIISGKFTLKASIDNFNQNSTILNRIGNALEQAAQYSGGGNSDNSGTHL